MKLKPMQGHVLVEIIPPEKTSCGVELPDYILSPEEVQARHRNPETPKALRGKVVSIGKWPSHKTGKMRLPDFGIGAEVLLNPFSGVQMHRKIGERFKMVPFDAVLAVVYTESV